MFDISDYDLGEAVEEGPDYDLFLGLGGVNLTFCLPCDFDSLRTPGSLILDSPQNVSSSPLCPNETHVFGIESGMSTKCRTLSLERAPRKDLH